MSSVFCPRANQQPQSTQHAPQSHGPKEALWRGIGAAVAGDNHPTVGSMVFVLQGRLCIHDTTPRAARGTSSQSAVAATHLSHVCVQRADDAYIHIDDARMSHTCAHMIVSCVWRHAHNHVKMCACDACVTARMPCAWWHRWREVLATASGGIGAGHGRRRAHTLR